MSEWSGRKARKARREARRQLEKYLANTEKILKPKPFWFPRFLWAWLGSLFINVAVLEKPFARENQLSTDKSDLHS